MPTHRIAPALLLAALGAGAAPALAAPAVVADIAPVHSLVARVMEGVGSPDVLLPPGASPHGYALRPSDAARLEAADVVVWVGPALTPWLADPLDSLAGSATRVTALDLPGLTLLRVRAGGPFDAHDHDHAEAEHDHDHDHAEAGHDHAADIDAHVWLDPLNARAIAAGVAAALGEIDPANAAAYAANAEAFAEEIDGLVTEVAAVTDSLEDRAFVVFHDGYQYFETRFALPAAGSIALHDADQPSPARMAEIQARIRDAGVTCVFAEPQFPEGLVATATEGSAARAGVLDPVGADLEAGPAFYPALIRGLADDLAACLAP
jgi:zinc transport system substrate-binding protein